MGRVKFIEWLTKRELTEASNSVKGLEIGIDDDIAQGDWQTKMKELVYKWAVLPKGPAKDAVKQQVDDYARYLVSIGNSENVVNTIVIRATQDGMGTFMKAASGGERAKNKARQQADDESRMYNKRASYRRSRF